MAHESPTLQARRPKAPIPPVKHGQGAGDLHERQTPRGASKIRQKHQHHQKGQPNLQAFARDWRREKLHHFPKTEGPPRFEGQTTRKPRLAIFKQILPLHKN